VNRIAGETGKCQTTSKVLISSYGPHFGEESPLVGSFGSGTIFFGYCNLNCVFCQNYSISQLGEGVPVDAEDLAAIMLSLQTKGCHNINLVSPTHVVPQIINSILLAVKKGLYLPLVYNTGGYDSVETLKLLDGIVDIYMPDMKYSSRQVAERYSGVKDYPTLNKAAILEMYQQVGDLRMGKEGVAQHGLLIRHLVLPNRLAGTEKIIPFIANEVSPNTYLNIMNQYRPYYHANSFPLLNRSISQPEYHWAINLAKQHGLQRLDKYNSTQLQIMLR
jgi:putative pyruvate formate lyase activating enzyme